MWLHDLPMIDLIIVSFLWSFSFVIIKSSLTNLDPNFVAAVRLLLAMFVFLPFFRLRGMTARLATRLLLLGAVQFGFMYACYTASFAYLPAYMLVLLTTTTPLFVVFFDMLFSKHNVPLFWVAALLAVLGAASLKFQGDVFTFNWKGVLLLQASNAAFAIGQIAYRHLARTVPGWNARASFALIYAGGAFVCLLASLVTADFASLTVTPLQGMMLLYLGVVASGLCFFLWNRGATRVGPATLGLMNNLKIPLGVIVAIAVLHESFNPGVLLISLALFFVSLLISRKAEHTLRSGGNDFKRPT